MSNLSSWSSVYNEDKPITNVIVVKVSIGTVPNEGVPAYMKTVMDQLTDPKLQKQGYMYYFIPVRDEATSVTFIDLVEMKSVRA